MITDDFKEDISHKKDVVDFMITKGFSSSEAIEILKLRELQEANSKMVDVHETMIDILNFLEKK